MQDLTNTALDIARGAGATFADIRIVDERRRHIFARRRSLRALRDDASLGYAVRVLVDGAWGFASATRLERHEVARTAERAVQIARASRRVPKTEPAQMAAGPARVDTRVGPCAEDPFALPAGAQAELVLEASNRMMDVEGITSTYVALNFTRARRIIANTDGSYLDLTNTFTEPWITCTAVVDGESQSRRFQRGGRQAGFEWVREIDPPGAARRWAEDAVMKCRAEEIPSGRYDLVLDPMHLSLTMHESVGHPTELDRILGWEANFAGRSFIRPDDIGALQYGSPAVSFTVDNTLDGGLGSWFYDDDGTPMQRFPVIRDGVLVGVSCTRETAPLIGWEASNGCCRADGFDRFPINRIPNLYMEPGPEGVTPDDLIAGVERGIYIFGQGSFSIDQERRNFQFGGDLFWLIENGKRTKPLRKVTYQAMTTEFWGSCDGVAGPAHWQAHGTPNCGKGEPAQSMRMTHGASFARFRNIRLGDGSR